MKNILIINSGSSSIKFQLISFPDEQVLIKGLIDKIGIPGSQIVYHYENEKKSISHVVSDHKEGLRLLFDLFTRLEQDNKPLIKQIDAVGHRVVHGGEDFTGSVRIDDQVLKVVKKNIPLAPLHNPPNIAGIEAIIELMPELEQVGVFDTAFHQSIPEHAYLYALPYNYYKADKIRRYGFHGTSHQYVFEQACKYLNKSPKTLKTISCHLGNGASISAIKNAKSMDTSMGLTPNEGLIMGTRSGDIDPGALMHIMENKNMKTSRINHLLNKESGLMGISTLSNDMRELEEEASKGNEQAKLAIKMFTYRVKKYIGSYLSVLNGADLLIFTGGIGEKSPLCRELICSEMDYAGILIDPQKNMHVKSSIEEISTAESLVKVLVIATNEEIMIGREVIKILKS